MEKPDRKLPIIVKVYFTLGFVLKSRIWSQWMQNDFLLSKYHRKKIFG